MTINQVRLISEYDSQLLLATHERRSPLAERLDNAQYFELVKVGPFTVSKHKGEGFWVQQDEYLFAVQSPRDVLVLVEGMMSGHLAVAYQSQAGIVRYQEDWLVDIGPRRRYSHDGERFLRTLASNGLKAVYHGTRVSATDGTSLAAAVLPLDS